MIHDRKDKLNAKLKENIERIIRRDRDLSGQSRISRYTLKALYAYILYYEPIFKLEPLYLNNYISHLNLNI